MMERKQTTKKPITDTHARGLVTGPEASRICGITYRRIDYMDRTGLAPPTQPADGSGTVRGYSQQDLVRMAIVATLCDFGLPAARIEDILAGYDPDEDDLLYSYGRQLTLALSVGAIRARVAARMPDPPCSCGAGDLPAFDHNRTCPRSERTAP